MNEIKKLSVEDLIERSKGLNANIEDFSNIGSIHLKLNGVYANLRCPTLIDSDQKPSMLLEFDSLKDKVLFTFSDVELREQSKILTNPSKYDQNYFLSDKENSYRVFVRTGVAAYLTEEEVMGLYVIFREIKKILEKQHNFN
ncbi:hypothetical protein [Heyndrickxia sporothermodurans]|uniref:hypothetical protein n=1 Tax=Heyndrickxia sporothermodurans TaxID=46224 RepID=UPI000D3512ED|nr:hypothetical protein [Heyndrickxia sporothermodurans]PTY89752.1 hypothetical protein B5V90_07485 [Heyndrickxia sporothermodurans]